MADVRNMKPVGTKALTVEQGMAAGYIAKGFALAQVIIAETVNTAQNLRRAVDTAFDLDTKAREETISVLNKWAKDLLTSAKDNANLRNGGMDDKALGRIARSAKTRTSEFTSIVKAMNNGFTRATLKEKTGVADVQNVGFHTIVELARAFNQSGATAGGRPADPFEVKLAKWLARQEVTTKHDRAVKAQAEAALATILPQDAAEVPY